ncbi:MAG: sulfotransferase [Cyanobacteriota bacterium]|nr:sulfotransferase [Cyanobacteriota bacterium]
MGLKRLWTAGPDPVFIIGTGRSGTHWLAEALIGHPELKVTLEVPPRFPWATAMVLDPGLQPRLLPKLIRNYRFAARRWAPRRLVDKSHPNLWMAEALQAAFPQATFLAIQREAYATVASMIRMAPVKAWHDQWRRYPIPNPFLGISNTTAERYDSLSLPEQCTLRWLAHRDRLRQLVPLLGEQLLVVAYETLMDDTRATLDRVAAALRLSSPIAPPPVHTESRSKWTQLLTAADTDRIDALVAAWDRGDLQPRPLAEVS